MIEIFFSLLLFKGEIQRGFGFTLKIALIQDKYNENKIWIIKKYKNRNIYYNQKIGDKTLYNFNRTSKKFLKSIFEDNEKALEIIEKI